MSQHFPGTISWASLTLAPVQSATVKILWSLPPLTTWLYSPVTLAHFQGNVHLRCWRRRTTGSVDVTDLRDATQLTSIHAQSRVRSFLHIFAWSLIAVTPIFIIFFVVSVPRWEWTRRRRRSWSFTTPVQSTLSKRWKSWRRRSTNTSTRWGLSMETHDVWLFSFEIRVNKRRPLLLNQLFSNILLVAVFAFTFIC